MKPMLGMLWFVLLVPIWASAASQVTLTDASVPPLPKVMAGSFAGVSNNALIVAGGVPSSDSVFVLPADSPGAWREFKLDSGVACGASVTVNDSLLCVGGVSGGACSRSVVRLRWQNGTLVVDRLADLPMPLGWDGAGVLNQTIYVVGGLDSPGASVAQKNLYALDLSAVSPQWRRLEPLPGVGRVQPAVIGQYYMLQVFGGRVASDGGFRTLSDCWTYRPRPLDGTTAVGWIRVADLPLPLATATTIASGQAHTLLAGADRRPWVAQSSMLDQSVDPYPHLLAYHAVTDSWIELGGDGGELAGSVAVRWRSSDVLVGGSNQGKVSNALQILAVHPFIRRLNPIDYGIVVLYLLTITGIGVYFSRKQKTTEEFSLGGRRMPWWVAALSLYATATSSISMMAVPALNYATNLVWLLLPLLTVIVLIPQAFLIIPMIRRLNLTSTYEYLERRFNPALRMFGSAQCIIFYAVGKASIVILLPSIAISAVTGLNVYVSILTMGVLTTLYTSLGGIDAVMWTDVLQAGVMLLAPTLTIIAIIHGLGGGVHELISTGVHYGKFDLAILSWNPTEPVIWISIITMILGITGFAGDQSMVQRVLATPNDKVARNATLGNWAVCVGGAILVQLMGVALFVYFHAHPDKLDPTMTNDKVVPLFVVQVMPVGVAGLILAGLFAASMSCLSGTVNSVATLMVQDFYLRWRPNAPDRTRLRLLKLFSYIVGLIGTGTAALLAGMQMRSIQETWTTIGSLCGAGFVGVYTLGMFSRRATSGGAMMGACSSVVITFLVKRYTLLHWTLYTPLAIVSCMVIGYVASLLSRATRRDLSGLTAFTPKREAVRLAEAVH
jgi:solute:Na+ symporter, SSS family